MGDHFRLMDVARRVVDDVNDLLDTQRPALLHDDQLRDSAGSITANIREAYGRRAGAERNQFFRYAHGSAEETDEHLRANFVTNRIIAIRYWRIHNRIAVIKRMIDTLSRSR